MIKYILIIEFIFFQIISFAQDFNAELITQETNIEVNNNRIIKSYYYEIKINNRTGEKYTRITIPYSKLNKVSNLEACIKDSNGTIVKKLKKGEITERSSISDFSFYEDDYIKEFTLKHNSYPYTLEYSYQVQQNEFLYIDYWTPIIDNKIPTQTASLKVSVPLNYKISYLNKNVKMPKIDTLENIIHYQWHTSYIEIMKNEVFSPPVYEFIPSVAITPDNFNYEKEGSFKDWGTYGNWQYELLKGLNTLPILEKGKILALVKDIKNDKEKIKILYHFLQDETRYINITIETGGLKPFPATYVADNKYGDCKALTNYFKAVLDYIGIQSYYTKVYAGNPVNKIDKNFPSQQFNHVLLYIPQQDEDIWLDCTSDGAFNYLGTFTQNRDAFIIDYNNSHFLKTPALNPMDVLEIRKIEITYNPGGANIRFQNTYKGDTYENLLHLERDYNESEKSRIVRNNIVDDGFQLKNYQIIKQDRDSVKIGLLYEATSQHIYKHYGNDILISNIPFSIPYPEKPEDRKLPVQINYPVYNIDTLIYEIPAGHKLHKTPDNYSIISKYGEFNFNIYENDKNVMVAKSLLFHSGYYPVSEYEEFYHFCHQVSEIENKTHLSLFK